MKRQAYMQQSDKNQKVLPDRVAASLVAIAMPRDTNPAGDIFGGWIMSQMDLAGSVHVRSVVKGKVVTVAVDAMTFLLPVFVGDHVSCYCETLKIGHTSINVRVETWVRRRNNSDLHLKVTEADFVYVQIDENRKPTEIILS